MFIRQNLSCVVECFVFLHLNSWTSIWWVVDKNANSRQHRELVCKVECVCIVQVVSRTFAACECLFIYLLLRLTLTKLAEKQWKTSKDMNFIEVQHSRCLQICSFHKNQDLHWWSDFWTIFLSFSSAFACMHCAHEWTTKCLPAVNGSVQYNYWTANRLG
jgi:hypothetical protein